ncbi:MAG TPA: hypothetical protein VFZ44_16900, partial [Pyrinomonadaceae bacterium]
MNKFKNSSRLAFASFLLALAFAHPASARQAAAPATAPARAAADAQTAKALSDAARLVTEFDVNGLKVLVKRREGSQTVAAGLFIRGGARNITAENAGVEALMLDVATEASTNFPLERMRAELSS